MGSVFNAVKLSAMTNDVYRSFFTRVAAFVEKEPKLANVKRAKVLVDASAAYSKAIDETPVAKKSLAAYDEACDNAWLALKLQARASSYHHNEANREAADPILDILDAIGSPTNLSYDKEYAAIANALAKFDALDRETLVNARCDDLVDHLRLTYEEFMAAQANETERRAARENGAVKNARANLMTAWMNLDAYLSISIEDGNNFDDFIKNINEVIEDIKK